MKNILIILAGLPYAGKTTLRNELSKRFAFHIISIDQINDERGIGKDEEKPITQEDWNVTYSKAYEQLKKFLSEGENVIFDGGSLLSSEREILRQIAKSIGVDTKTIYVNTPIEEIKERWQKNSVTKERGHVPEDLFKSALVMWEEPVASEHPILYNKHMNLEDWLKNNIKETGLEPE